MAAPTRREHPSRVAEMTLADLEGKGWRVTWDGPGNVFLVTCPHRKYTYRWPVSLSPGWRWDDHFKRMMGEHKQRCAQA